MYVRNTTIAGNTKLVRKYHTSRWQKRGLPRSPNTNATTETQEQANIRRDAHELTILLNENFCDDDYHIQLTYKKEERPPDPEEAKADRRRFLRKLRALFKENGLPLKYIVLTGYGKRGTPHHHLVISGGVPGSKIAKLWTKGHLHSTSIYDEDNHEELAWYLAKHRTEWKKHDGKGKMWSKSKNIIRPPSKIEVIKKASSFSDNPRIPKGWYLDKESLRQGVNADGYLFQDYILVKIRPPGRKRE